MPCLQQNNLQSAVATARPAALRQREVEVSGGAIFPAAHRLVRCLFHGTRTCGGKICLQNFLMFHTQEMFGELCFD